MHTQIQPQTNLHQGGIERSLGIITPQKAELEIACAIHTLNTGKY